ncbi:hypothetical protein H0I76_04990 [Limibaculum sp. M0105]|uniref:Uncharacterized protein n=1 Tax=Thermohalobaculum xanthum TaxID=2753746 RepID=A0A8J7M556_9RHOB|nr:hypothetical protein [Thermohalobaculum xanthum]MBK0398534.1 hypothetical protein [Thermohalobaculum xanthum]
MAGGTFNVHRSIWTHAAFRDSSFSEREAWVWILSEAAWRPVTVRSGRVVVDLERGQLCHSLRFMADRWGWSKDRVRRFLTRLENRDMIATQTATGQLVIDVRNYDKFQNSSGGGAREARRDPRQKRDTSATDNNTLKTLNPTREGPDGNSGPEMKPPRASRMHPDAVLTEELVDDAVKLGLHAEDAERVWQKFRDYSISVAGPKGLKTNWRAAWRNWVRRELEWQPCGGRKHPGNRRLSAAAIVAARQDALNGIDS